MKLQTIVVKIGTSSLTDAETGNLAISTIAALVETLTRLRNQGHGVILVTSGAVGVGCGCLGLQERPRTLAQKQAAAAVGQGRLMRVYDDLFATLEQPIAQVLLSRSDLVDRHRYINAYNTFAELLRWGVIPIVNENDTVATEELRFGDNDTLSALVASLVEANWLFLLTDVDRLYSADPRRDPNAVPLDRVSKLEELEALQIGSAGSTWGTGGMATKIAAARIATDTGVRTAIAAGRQPNNIEKILQGAAIGTQFEARDRAVNARKRWIAYGLVPAGKLYLDDGAVKAICEQGKSLLAVGIAAVEGQFHSADAVQLCAKNAGGVEVARGIVNYAREELDKICGRRSEDIAAILGDRGAETVVHRDNLVLVTG